MAVSAAAGQPQTTKVVHAPGVDLVWKTNPKAIANPTFLGRVWVWVDRNLHTPEGLFIIAKAAKESFHLLGLAVYGTRFAGWKSWIHVVVRITGYTVKGLNIPLLILSLPGFLGLIGVWKDLSWSDIASSSSAAVSQALFFWDEVIQGSPLAALIPFVSIAGDGIDLAEEGEKLRLLDKVPAKAAEPTVESKADRRVALQEARTLAQLRVAKLALITLAGLVLVWQIAIPFVSASWAAAITVSQYENVYGILACASSILAVVNSYYRATMLELPTLRVKAS